MKLRIVGVALVATLAVTGLAGCRTNVGTAATVSGQRISESDVGKYITPRGVDPSVAAQAKHNGQVVSPRSQVLQFLIQEQVFEKVLNYTGTLPSPAQLAAVHDDAATLLLQTNLAGTALDKAVRAGLPGSGITSGFADTYLRVQELEYTIIQRKHLTQLPELVALVKKAGVAVSVSPRYGTWDPATLGLDGKAALPSYLSPQPGGDLGAVPSPAAG